MENEPNGNGDDEDDEDGYRNNEDDDDDDGLANIGNDANYDEDNVDSNEKGHDAHDFRK